jgi:hypothetical protein
MKGRKELPIRSAIWITLALLLTLGLAGARPAKADGVAPRVVGFSPAAGAGQVSLDALVAVTWDRPMPPDTKFSVTSPAGFVDGTFVYDPRTFTVTFTPQDYLRPDTRYDALVTGQVDAQGHWQQELVQWSFTTVVPTSVSLTDFSPTNTGSNWWWTAWPWLMLLISAGSVAGMIHLWRRRPAIDVESLD